MSFLYLCLFAVVTFIQVKFMRNCFFKLSNYLKYKQHARRGVTHHSPFIYEFSRKVFESGSRGIAGNTPEAGSTQLLGKSIKKASKKNFLLLLRLAGYFSMQKVFVVGKEQDANPLYSHFTWHNNDGETLAFAGYDMIVVTGETTGKEMKQYFEEAVKYANNNSVFVLEGIYRTTDTMDAWEEIKANPGVTVTIDLYKLGVTFFRKESSKENFVIKY